MDYDQYDVKTVGSDTGTVDTFSMISTNSSSFTDEVLDFYQNNGNAVTTPVSIEKCCMIFMDSEFTSREDLESCVGMPFEALPREISSMLINSPMVYEPIYRKENVKESSLDATPEVIQVEEETSVQESLKEENDNVVQLQCNQFQDASVSTSDFSDVDFRQEKYIEVIPSGRRLCIYIVGFELDDREELDLAMSRIKHLLEGKYSIQTNHTEAEIKKDSKTNQIVKATTDLDATFDCPVPLTIDDKKIARPSSPVLLTEMCVPEKISQYTSRPEVYESQAKVTPECSPKEVINASSVTALDSSSKIKIECTQKEKAEGTPNSVPAKEGTSPFSMWANFTKEIRNELRNEFRIGKETKDKNLNLTEMENNYKKTEPPNEKSPYGFLQKVISARINSVINNSTSAEHSSGYYGKESSEEAVPKLANNLLYKLCLSSARKCNNEKETKHVSERKHTNRMEGNTYFKRKPLPNIPSPTREITKTGTFNMYRTKTPKSEHHTNRSMRNSEVTYKSLDNFRFAHPKYETFSYGRPSHDNGSLPQKISRCKIVRSNGIMRNTTSVEATDSDRRWRP